MLNNTNDFDRLSGARRKKSNALILAQLQYVWQSAKLLPKGVLNQLCQLL